MSEVVTAVQPLESEYLFRAELAGITPLLMAHPRGMEQQSDDDPAVAQSRRVKTKTTPEQEAANRAYVDYSGALYVPTAAVYRAIMTAAKWFKDPVNKRAGLTGAMAGALYLPDHEELVLMRDGDPITEYVIDTRRAVNRNSRTAGAILVSRPRIETPWTLGIEFAVDGDLIHPDILARVLATAGKRVGIMAFRPEKLGPFGRFQILDYGTVGFNG